MKIHAVKRTAGAKHETKQLKRDGFIPANLYLKSKEKGSEAFAIKAADFEAIIRSIQKGHLPSTVLTLVMENLGEKQVVVKEIQYHLTSYAVIHLDFEEVTANSKIRVKIPVECENQVDCAGIKQGGFLRQPKRLIPVECYGNQIPPFFSLDIKHLGIKQSLRIKDIPIPEGVKVLASLEDVVAVIAKR